MARPLAARMTLAALRWTLVTSMLLPRTPEQGEVSGRHSQQTELESAPRSPEPRAALSGPEGQLNEEGRSLGGGSRRCLAIF